MDRLIGVVWNDRNYQMFAPDLRDRGEPLDQMADRRSSFAAGPPTRKW